MPPLLTNSNASCRSEKLTPIVPPQCSCSTTCKQRPQARATRPEHCRHCRHEDCLETFWTGLIRLSPGSRSELRVIKLSVLWRRRAMSRWRGLLEVGSERVPNPLSGQPPLDPKVSDLAVPFYTGAAHL